VELRGEELLPGAASGALLVLDAPLSFWGGVDPGSGRITQVRHPQVGQTIAGTILALPATIGSSSSSSVLLELIAGGRAPAALVLRDVDAILLLGAVVARELGWAAPPALRIEAAGWDRLVTGRHAALDGGRLVVDRS